MRYVAECRCCVCSVKANPGHGLVLSYCGSGSEPLLRAGKQRRRGARTLCGSTTVSGGRGMGVPQWLRAAGTPTTNAAANEDNEWRRRNRNEEAETRSMMPRPELQTSTAGPQAHTAAEIFLSKSVKGERGEGERE